jgi:hypothetical protein
VAMGSQLQDETIMVFILGEEDGKIVWKWVGGEDSSGGCLPCFIIRLIETIKANSDLH